ncbi:uncharacterized protein G2W53_006813 [Senna tora]|uniref:Uncharacterized protein n=1 Tax=Senna tora TaxID=362788 RepID=A0A835CCW8_9FABA|nr:uncharacterized protein G2W53_006813 [Senna tora]
MARRLIVRHWFLLGRRLWTSDGFRGLRHCYRRRLRRNPRAFHGLLTGWSSVIRWYCFIFIIDLSDSDIFLLPPRCLNIIIIHLNGGVLNHGIQVLTIYLRLKHLGSGVLHLIYLPRLRKEKLKQMIRVSCGVIHTTTGFRCKTYNTTIPADVL